MRGVEAAKAVNQWLTSHGHRPLDRKVGYIEFAQGVINILRLQSRDLQTKNQAKAFVCEVARSLVPHERIARRSTRAASGEVLQARQSGYVVPFRAADTHSRGAVSDGTLASAGHGDKP